MARIRRTAHLLFRLQEVDLLHVDPVRGRGEIAPETRFVAVSILTGEETPLTQDELGTLLAIPERSWIDPGEYDAQLIDAFARQGLVVSEVDDPALVELRRRDERLIDGGWELYAAFFHAMTTWRDVDVARYPELDERGGEEFAERFLERFGPPPPHFHELEEPLGVRKLPLERQNGDLFRVLDARRTTRAFAPGASLTEAQLSTLLYTVYGCHGTAPLHRSHVALKKTSPSGGALHPIEVYPLLAGVEGVDPGLYHYRARDHALELATRLEQEEARALAEKFMCGQSYFAEAQAHFVMTARFPRSFWKYRQHDKAYPALLMEIGHLSQTLYLVATELGLGAFITAAINGANIEERLGLEPADEGAIAICGCGVPSRELSELEPDFEPYDPRNAR